MSLVGLWKDSSFSGAARDVCWSSGDTVIAPNPPSQRASSDASGQRPMFLQPALEAGWIEMTVPDKPNSSRQQYRLSVKGVARRKVEA
ncbi:MAG: Fic family protein [Casimicrobiaceae bacterium]